MTNDSKKRRPYGMTQTELVAWILGNRVTPASDGSGCLYWDGSRSRRGYGQIKLDGRTSLVHRLILAEATGRDVLDTPADDYALHSCGRGHLGCIAPDHLRWGTQSDNMADAVADGTHNMSSRTSCPKGHALIAGNLAAYSLKCGARRCLLCSRAHGLVKHRASRGNPITLDDAIAYQLAKYPDVARAALGSCMSDGPISLLGPHVK